MVNGVEKIEKDLRLLDKSSAGIGDGDWIRESATLLHEITMKREDLGKYLKFKCIATTTGKSCRFYGLVFTKASSNDVIPSGGIENPKLILCEGSLDINKGDREFASRTFSSIEESNTKLILIEKSVSPEYQQYFQRLMEEKKRKITTITDMKKHRLARFPRRPNACKKFKWEEITEDLNGGRKKTLMYFEGCDSITVLLKGSSISKLKLIKGYLQSVHNHLLNDLLESKFYMLAFPKLEFETTGMDGIVVSEVKPLENEISSFIACELHRQLEKKTPSKSSPVICQHKEEFYQLRRSLTLPEAKYITSLSHCKDWNAIGGKSKAVFAKTRDERLIIKEIDKAQYDSFIGFCPRYFEYLSEALLSNNKTCLAKIFGLYEVTRDRRTKFLIVMENLSFNRKVAPQYDLKGCLHSGRLAPESSPVLLDLNFKNDMKKSPLQISPSAILNLELAIRNDTEFLSGVNVMDYSLILAVDEERQQLVCGIVDYLVPYEWKKKLETVAKSSMFKKPTVIPPDEYKERFVKFMLKEILAVEEASSSV